MQSNTSIPNPIQTNNEEAATQDLFFLEEILEDCQIDVSAFYRALKRNESNEEDFLQLVTNFPLSEFVIDPEATQSANNKVKKVVDIFKSAQHEAFNYAYLINFILRIQTVMISNPNIPSISSSDIEENLISAVTAPQNSAYLSRLNFESISSPLAYIINHPSLPPLLEGVNGYSAAMSAAILSEFSGTLDAKVARPLMLSGLAPMALYTLKGLLDRYDPNKKYFNLGRHGLEAASLFLGTFMFTLRASIEGYIYVQLQRHETDEEIDNDNSNLVLAITASSAALISLIHVILRKFDEKNQREQLENDETTEENRTTLLKIKSYATFLKETFSNRAASFRFLKSTSFEVSLLLFDSMLFANMIHSNIGTVQVLNDSYHTDDTNRGYRYLAGIVAGVLYAFIRPFLNKKTAANFLNEAGGTGILLSLSEILLAMNGIGETLEDEDRYIIGTVGGFFIALPLLVELFSKLNVHNALSATCAFLNNATTYLNAHFFSRLDSTNVIANSERTPINSATLSRGYLTLFQSSSSSVSPIDEDYSSEEEESCISNYSP